jgi:DNA integrity scanning protein DisA with diadenylate cyclase activity
LVKLFLIEEFNNLSNIFNASEEELSTIIKNRATNLKKELDSLKEQILVGKKV